MKRPRGRPPVAPGDTSTDVHLTIPSSMYDRAYKKAGDRETVQDVIRRALEKDLETQNRQS